MDVGSFGMFNGFCYVVPCLFVYFNMYYKAGFLSIRAPPGLLRLNGSLAYPRGAWTVGNVFLWCMIVLNFQKGRTVEIKNVVNIIERVYHKW